MKRLRKYIRKVLIESHFPLSGGEKLRIHHSRAGSRADGTPQISGFVQEIGYKPMGLWYECQDGSSVSWKDFCTTGFSHGYSRYDAQYNVVLNDYEILFIKDEAHFEKFHNMYSVNHRMDPDGTKGFDKMIDWPKVAEHYAGIEICPYLYSKRSVFWYYGWDISSGCVWSSDGIKKLIKNRDCE